MEDKLISMTNFVENTKLEVSKVKETDSKVLYASYLSDIFNYADFLKQPLTLGMFVPCDEKGNIINEPYNDGINDQYYNSAIDAYNEAKSRVLFEGFEFESKEHLEDFSILKNDKISFNYDDKYKTFEIGRFYFKNIEDLIEENLVCTRPITNKNDIWKINKE